MLVNSICILTLVERSNYFYRKAAGSLSKSADAGKEFNSSNLSHIHETKGYIDGVGPSNGFLLFFNDNQKKEEVDREVLFQKRIADLGFQRQQLPWNLSEKPVFDLPPEETRLFAERELEDGTVSAEEVERRVLMELLSQTSNFRSFYKRLHYELKRARRYKRLLSICLVGVDKLEAVTYQYGTDTSDAILKNAARVLLNCIRDVDIPGRCREDTFGVILPETGIEGAEVAAERIRTKLEHFNVTHNWQSVSMTVSVGVSTFPNCAQNLDEMFALAAEALLAGMQRGGNGVVFAPQRPGAPT